MALTGYVYSVFFVSMLFVTCELW